MKKLATMCRGSHAHNLNTPTSDYDLLDVVVWPVEGYLGLRTPKDGSQSINDDVDTVSYELRHYLKLLLAGNPNVLPYLWNSSEMITVADPLFNGVVDARSRFLSCNVFRTFGGLAVSNLKKMKVMEPQVAERYVFLENELLAKVGKTYGLDQSEIDEFGGLFGEFRTLRDTYFSGGMLGASRRKLILEKGYDTKNAYAIVLTLTLLLEVAQTGQFTMDRGLAGDKDLFLDIKAGKYSLADVMGLSDELFAECKLLEQSGNHVLPHTPDTDFIERLCVEMILHTLL